MHAKSTRYLVNCIIVLHRSYLFFAFSKVLFFPDDIIKWVDLAFRDMSIGWTVYIYVIILIMEDDLNLVINDEFIVYDLPNTNLFN